jgi:hypothetical protein
LSFLIIFNDSGQKMRFVQKQCYGAVSRRAMAAKALTIFYILPKVPVINALRGGRGTFAPSNQISHVV